MALENFSGQKDSVRDEDSLRVLRSLLDKSPKLRFPPPKDKKEAYLSLIANYRPKFGIDDDTKSQFIAFKKYVCIGV